MDVVARIPEGRCAVVRTVYTNTKTETFFFLDFCSLHMTVKILRISGRIYDRIIPFNTLICKLGLLLETINISFLH